MSLLSGFQEKNRNFIELLHNIPFYLYIVKCLLGTIICHTLYKLFPDHQLYWSIVSVLLVLAPDPVDSMKLSFARMKANIAGASIGLLYFLCPFPPLLSLCLAVLTTILVCWYFVLGNASRSALAALITHGQRDHRLSGGPYFDHVVSLCGKNTLKEKRDVSLIRFVDFFHKKGLFCGI